MNALRQTIKKIPGVKPLGRWARSLTYKYYCPVCRRRVGEFNPLEKFFTSNQKKYGWPYQPEDSETFNAKQYRCPECDASDRYRLYALYLNQRLTEALRHGACDLLEFAPQKSFGRYLRTFPGLRYRTADLFAEGVDDKVDIQDMRTYPDGRFDVFICSHVLEHVPDDRRALAELLRILKPGGWGILMLPINLKAAQIDEDPNVTDEAERWRRFGQCDHVRLYTKAGFLERVRAAGFKVNEYCIDYFGEKVFQRCGITPQSVLYIVEKS